MATLEERYRLLLEKKRHQERYDPGLEAISMLNAPDVIGEGLGEEVMAIDADWSPEKRATLATIARIAPDAIGAFGGMLKGVHDAAKRGFYDDLPDIPSNFKQSGAIHGQNSKLFPPSWRGKEGRLRQLQDEGYSQDEIWQKAREETGFGIWDQPLYREGKHIRSDAKMNVPDINLTEGKYSVDDLADLDPRQSYQATDFRQNPTMDYAYPPRGGGVRLAEDVELLGQPLDYKLGKYNTKGQQNYLLNKEADYIPATEDSLLPEWAGADQGIIQDIERFAPGGKHSDPNSRNWAGNVEQRAVKEEFKTILDLRAQGLNNQEIIERLSADPIFKKFDTPNIFQEVPLRRDMTTAPAPSGRPSRYSQPKGETVIEREYVPYEVEVPVPQPALPKYDIDKVRFPTRSKRPKKKNLSMMDLLDEIANYA